MRVHKNLESIIMFVFLFSFAVGIVLLSEPSITGMASANLYSDVNPVISFFIGFIIFLSVVLIFMSFKENTKRQ